MAELIKSMDKKVKNLTAMDVAFTKIAVMFFMLTIAKLWPTILSLEWYWYAIPWIGFAIKPMASFFKK